MQSDFHHGLLSAVGGTMLWGMKKWLAWLIVGGPVVVYAIGKLLSH